jgi:hypothetical protein
MGHPLQRHAAWDHDADFAQHLTGIARPLYATEPCGVELDAAVYAFDASTIDLCLSVFAWAPFRSTKAAIKLPANDDDLERWAINHGYRPGNVGESYKEYRAYLQRQVQS